MTWIKNLKTLLYLCRVPYLIANGIPVLQFCSYFVSLMHFGASCHWILGLDVGRWSGRMVRVSMTYVVTEPLARWCRNNKHSPLIRSLHIWHVRQNMFQPTEWLNRRPEYKAARVGASVGMFVEQVSSCTRDVSFPPQERSRYSHERVGGNLFVAWSAAD